MFSQTEVELYKSGQKNRSGKLTSRMVTAIMWDPGLAGQLWN